jgi:tetratricopeptide (TPR) repeat protein
MIRTANPSQEHRFRELRRLGLLLSELQRPALCFVLYTDYANFLSSIAELEQFVGDKVGVVRLEQPELNPFRHLQSLPAEPKQIVGMVFVGNPLAGSQTLSDLEIVSRHLNYQRERIREFSHSVLFFFQEELLVELIRLAPDFWSWRSGVFDLRSVPEGVKAEAIPRQITPELYTEDAFEAERLRAQVELYRELIAQEANKPEADIQFIFDTKLRLAGSLKQLGRYSEALNIAQEAHELAHSLAEDQQTQAKAGLAIALQDVGRYSEAEPLYREALKMRREALPEGHPDIATSLNNLAALYGSQGRYSEAEPLYREALGMSRKALPEGHPDIATSLNNLAALYDSQGRYSEAEPLYREALKMRREALPEGHPNIATSLNNLALLYESQGRYSEAEPLYREALKMRREALPEGHPNIATSLNNLAALYGSQGRYSEAEPLYREALKMRREALPEGHPDIAASLNNLAALYGSQGRYSEAEPLYREGIAILEAFLQQGFVHPNLPTVLRNYATFLLERGRTEEAARYFARAREMEAKLGQMQ